MLLSIAFRAAEFCLVVAKSAAGEFKAAKPFQALPNSS
ncbi:hypothetical protein F542_20160 [Bibersteinia trehalosi USDA-ARS-USMARC-188]|uniref:Uncharacterized protein n=2 Tax=Bibersteinia trehalosi TaxID=47735 RepID=A0A4V7ICG3_BIBTR|nr:hypothetical protein F542_20160 [Bibersteinia trehalosi USDA-ARS-USMARC-188]AHG85061.1 hypothetical protein F543_22060 [Bibersteinia trehalosi USDA-ARS-USMARC-189]